MLTRGLVPFALVMGCIAACSGAPTARRSAPPPAAAPGPAPAPEPPPPPPSGPRPPALREDERGIAGAPRDETSFEYDVEVGEASQPLLDGVPPVSAAVARALMPYLESRRAVLAGVSADSNELLVLSRLSETTHVHLVQRPLGMRRQLTFGPEPVEQASFRRGSDQLLTYRGDVGGHENHQIFLLDLATRTTRMLTDGEHRHGPFRWSQDGRLAFTSNARNGRDMDLYVLGAGLKRPRLVAELEGQWVVSAWSKDSRKLLMQQFLAIDQSTVHLVDAATGQREAIAPLQKGVAVRSAAFSADGKRLYVTSNRGRDTLSLFEVTLDTMEWKPVLPDLRWDIEEVAVSSNGKTLAYLVNEDGYSSLRVLDLASNRSRTIESLEKGVVSGVRFVGGGARLAFTHTTPRRPANARVLELSSQRVVSWTDSEVGGLDPKRFRAPELVRIRSFDGVRVPAFLYRPAGKGPFPVLIWMHGGPEDQFRPAFDPVVQYYAAARGVAVLAPNVRGSDGYGKRYLARDDGRRRHEAVKDVGAVLDWIGKRRDLDGERVGIHGASYGGFMVLAALVAYPKRIRAGCSVVGMSNLVSFLENTSGYRQDLRRAEYGDERQEAMRRYLESISPLGSAERIQSALLVVHGENDPRVPVDEARQLVQAVRANGRDAWFLVARGEGHSFRKRRNRDTFLQTMAEFFERYLVQRAPLSKAGVEGEEEPSDEASDLTEVGDSADP